MKFFSIDRRLRKMEPEPVDPSESEEASNSALLVELWQPYFFDRLRELGLADLIDEFKAALQTIGPRPFGHSRRDDRPVWICIDDVSNRHHEVTYRIRAADFQAWADLSVELGEPEDSEEVTKLRECAARDLEWEARDKQTFCDQCGGDLGGWSCYSSTRSGGSQKLCKVCAGYAGP